MKVVHRVLLPLLVAAVTPSAVAAAPISLLPLVQAASPIEDGNVRIAARLFENVINAHDFGRATDYVATWAIQHNPSTGRDMLTSREQIQKHLNELKTAFPDFRYQIVEYIPERNKVAVRYRFTGTHKGEFMGIAPTDKKVTVWGVEVLRIEQGMVREFWGTPINVSLLMELGVLPLAGNGEG